MTPLASTLPYPAIEEVQAALEPIAELVEVAANAVRTSGAAFGIAVDGGCVFGAVYQGEVTVEIGGYVKDGGCLAIYGH